MTGRLRLGSAAVYARDRKRLAAFYQSVFDMKLLVPGKEQEASLLAFEERGGYDLSIVDHPLAVQTVFHADSPGAVKRLWDKVGASGYPVRGLFVQPEGISIRFPDPEGNQIMVLWPQELYEEGGSVDWRRVGDDGLARWIYNNRNGKSEGGRI